MSTKILFESYGYMKTNILLLALILIVGMGCQKEDTNEVSTLALQDYSIGLINEEINIQVNNRTVKAYLSKPPGSTMDIVLVLHGGTADYNASVAATLKQYEKEEGGKQFLDEGQAILALQYTEFADENDMVGVTKGIMEMEDVLAAVDLLQLNPWIQNDFTIQKVYAFGHSRGGGNALLAGVYRSLSAVVATAAPLNWIAIRDSIETEFLEPTELQKENFYATTAEWNDFPELWNDYSPALRLGDYKTPFLILSGAADQASFQDMAVQMKADYDACTDCIDGSIFLLHPFGHSNWASPATLFAIKTFIEMY